MSECPRCKNSSDEIRGHEVEEGTRYHKECCPGTCDLPHEHERKPMKRTTKVAYIAARFDRRDEMHYVVRLLKEELEITVNSRWITDEPVIVNAPAEEQEGLRQQWAMYDMVDVLDADTFIAFTEDLSRAGSGKIWLDGIGSVPEGIYIPSVWARGGRHVELGIALAKAYYDPGDMRMIVIGPRENIFCSLPTIEQYTTIQEFVGAELEARASS